MIDWVCKAWAENADTCQKLDTFNGEPKDLVVWVIENILNPYMGKHKIPGLYLQKGLSTEVKEIDDGDWQGSKIFILRNDVYQPSIRDYFYTHIEYGSCDVCDSFLLALSPNCTDKRLALKNICLTILQCLHQCKDDED